MPNQKKVLMFLLLLAGVSALGGLAGGTQYAASALGYPRQFGAPLMAMAGTRLYPPWACISWARQFERSAPKVFAVSQAIAFAGGLAAFAALLAAVVHLKGQAGSVAHGSARWATKDELGRAGLLDGAGVVLCQTNDARYTSTPDGRGGLQWKMSRPGDLIRHCGPEHVLIFAPTRSGKGIGAVIPTLLSWEGSVLVYDIKKELWSLTAGWRRKFSHCWRFEPTAPGGVRYNPLFEIRRGADEVRDAQTLAEILIDPDGEADNKNHWKLSGATLLTGAILHVLYAEADKSLRGVSAFLSDPERTQFETLRRMLTTPHLRTGPHPVVAQTARAMMNKSDNELSSVVSTAKAALSLYDDAIVADNTSVSDFRIADLMNADNPVSLYLVVPPSDIDRTRPLIRLMLNQIGKRLTEKMQVGGDARTYTHRLLMLLDEFPSLGRLSFFQTTLAYCASYGIKCFIICQSLNQLESAYGQNNSILDNCHVRMTYTALDERTAKRISDLIGQATASKRQTSLSGKSLFGSRSVNESEQEFARQLLTPDEILRLRFDDAILIVGGQPAYRARKVMYYLDARFRDRVLLGKNGPPNSPSQQKRELLRGHAPSEWQGLVAHVPEPPPVPAAPPPPPSVPQHLPAVTPPNEPPPARPQSPQVWTATFRNERREEPVGTADQILPSPPNVPVRKLPM